MSFRRDGCRDGSGFRGPRFLHGRPRLRDLGTTDYQRALFDLLKKAGQDYGLKSFGGRALHCLRIEKGFGTWAREFRPIYGPYEAGLGRFVDLNKGDFIGRDAAV